MESSDIILELDSSFVEGFNWLSVGVMSKKRFVGVW